MSFLSSRLRQLGTKSMGSITRHSSSLTKIENISGMNAFLLDCPVSLKGSVNTSLQSRDFMSDLKTSETLKSLEESLMSLDHGPSFSGPNEIEFLLYTRNVRCADAISEMANYLHIPINSFTAVSLPVNSGMGVSLSVFRVSTHGLKGRPATVQDPTAPSHRALRARRPDVRLLEPLIEFFSDRTDVRVGNFTFVPAEELTQRSSDAPATPKQAAKAHLKASTIKGRPQTARAQRISVAVRGLDAGQRDVLDSQIQALVEQGFMNFFDTSRSAIDGREELGVALLKRNWKKVVALYARIEGHEALGAALGEGDFASAAEMVSATTVDSNANVVPLLHVSPQLKQAVLTLGSTRDGKLAVSLLNWQVLRRCVQSSLKTMWNEVASFRIDTFGPQLLVGDLVAQHNTKGDIQAAQLRTVGLGEQKLFTMHDVLLPLLGSESVFPSNDVNRKYSQVLEARELSFASNIQREDIRKFLARTRYLPVISKVQDVQWDLCTATEEGGIGKGLPLVPCALDRLALLEGRADVQALLARTNDVFDVSAANSVGLEEDITLTQQVKQGGRRGGRKREGEQAELALRLRATIPANANGLMMVRELLHAPLDQIVVNQ